MKSFIAYPPDIEKTLSPDANESTYQGKVMAHYELFKKINKLQGSIVKCGIAAEEAFIRFARFRNLIASQSQQQVIAFEKPRKALFFDSNNAENGILKYKLKSRNVDVNKIEQKLLKKGLTEKVNFVQGNIEDAIPDYLVENPELKISFLNLDLDDYESTYFTLQFFYPRLVCSGLLILDNYYKHEEDYKAVNDYFRSLKVQINNYSVNKGPHYIVRR